ncbi:MAG: glycosyltransferase family 4 protein [Chloroflexota bacterium]
MQRLSYRLLHGLQKQCAVVGVVWDCPRPLLPAFLVWAAARICWQLMRQRGHTPVVHFGDPIMAFLAPLCRAAHVPTVVTAHGLDVTHANPLYQVLVRACLGSVDRIVCISQAAKQACLERGVPGTRITVITPGVDCLSVIERGQARDRLSRLYGTDLHGSVVLVTVGRLIHRKGVAWFVERVFPRLLQRFPELRYLVVGDGPDRVSVDIAIRRYSLQNHVLLLGRIPDGDMNVCLSAADVFVMPNVPVAADMEGFGLVALEAASAGLPVVAAALDGITDAIEEGLDGYLVPAGDVAAFEARISELLGNMNASRAFGRRAAVHTAKAHSWSAMAQAYMTIYDELRAASTSMNKRQQVQR